MNNTVNNDFLNYNIPQISSIKLLQNLEEDKNLGLNIKNKDQSIKSNDDFNIDKKLYMILNNYDNIYVKEYLLKESQINEYFCIKTNTLELLLKYIIDYTKKNVVAYTNFNTFMLELLQNIKIQNNSVNLIMCVSLLDYNYTHIHYYRKLLGYSKIYNNLKDVINNIFKYNIAVNYTYNSKYIAYLIVLLDNDQLVYKNLKPLLTTLIRYIKNEIIEKNIEACAILTSAITLSIPTLFNDKLVASLISYYTKIIFNPKNYINNKISYLVEAVKLMLTTYDNISPSYVSGLFRESIGKMEEYRNTTIFEEIQMLANIADILNDLLEKNTSNTIESYVKDYKTYMSPKFIKINFKSKTNLIRNPVYEQERFIINKYKYQDKLLHYHNCYDRIDLVNDLTNIDDAGKIMIHFKNYNQYIDWNDFVGIKITIGVISYLFNDYFLTNRKENHKGMIKLFFTNLDRSNIIYFAKCASINHCYYILIEIYFQYINNNTFEDIKTRKIILTAVNELEFTEQINTFLIDLKKIKNTQLNSIGFKNLLLLLIIILSKLKPKKYKNDEEYDSLTNIEKDNNRLFITFTKQYMTFDNEYSDYYIGLLFYLEKDINRPFYNYFDIILELMSIKVRDLKNEIDKFNNRTFPLIFQMTYKEITEIGILFKNFKDSKFIRKYNIILDLLKTNDEFNITEMKDQLVSNLDYDSLSSLTESSNISIEDAIDHEKEFLKTQRQIIIEKYDLAEREKELEEEKYRLAQKEHNLLEMAKEKFSKEQRKLIKQRYKETKKAQQEITKKYEKIKKEKDKLEKIMKEKQAISPFNILEDNLNKARMEHEEAKKQYNNAKIKYKKGQQKYTDAFKDLEILKKKLIDQHNLTQLSNNNDINTKNINNNNQTEKLNNINDNMSSAINNKCSTNNQNYDAMNQKDTLSKNNNKNLSDDDDYQADYSPLFNSYHS
ncbi:hypothetical protein EBI_27307 [Enterocytozoon bieneusi H348]|nr:hypothetical protein EBI_27307 [Enterocytozoon bieneusi H348]|eukprot:XP_002650305.1 hypothetical protein EBI_27307 [Enterocytozoon bieneusi H348]